MNVGGIPKVTIAKDGSIIEPLESNCLLAQQIVRGRKRGFLTKKFEREALESLMYAEADNEKACSRWFDAMLTKAKDRSREKALLRFLMGYRS